MYSSNFPLTFFLNKKLTTSKESKTLKEKTKEKLVS